MKDVPLPSGAVLSIGDVPFAEAKGLFQAIMRELRTLNITSADPNAILTGIASVGFSSPEIESWVVKCLARCLYAGQRITEATFEPVNARQDYTTVCMEVVKEVVGPFTKSLYARFMEVMAKLGATQK